MKKKPFCDLLRSTRHPAREISDHHPFCTDEATATPPFKSKINLSNKPPLRTAYGQHRLDEDAKGRPGKVTATASVLAAIHLAPSPVMRTYFMYSIGDRAASCTESG